ncbi:GntR family transcriptional regulator [Vibrio sp. WXL210]|uniref:GntR family transcriptional regulator n=1 Tax=Vibrio sp. WXL210 TaxID=3450709 RepID=UPI003EC72755
MGYWKRRYFNIGMQIEELLMSGDYRPGQRLPTETQLGEKLNVSRSAIREALIMLELKGVIEVRKGSGIYYSESINQGHTMAKVFAGDIGLFELLQARQVIDSTVAGLAASVININELRRVKAVFTKMEGTKSCDVKMLEELEYKFHSLIAESTQNRAIIGLSAEMWRCMDVNHRIWGEINEKCLGNTSMHQTWLEDHRKILYSLQHRDSSGANQAVWRYIDNIKANYINQLKNSQSQISFDDSFFINNLELNYKLVI